MGVYEENIVPIKISHLAEYMARKKRLSLEEALVCIYSNPMYKELYDEGAKWWYMSTADLYEEFERAVERASQEVSPEAFEFLVYTLEKYALSKGMSGLEALSLLKRYDADLFLMRNYDLLHTQGTGYVLDEIDGYLNKRKKR
jgi:hypothetical protein